MGEQATQRSSIPTIAEARQNAGHKEGSSFGQSSGWGRLERARGRGRRHGDSGTATALSIEAPRQRLRRAALRVSVPAPGRPRLQKSQETRTAGAQACRRAGRLSASLFERPSSGLACVVCGVWCGQSVYRWGPCRPLMGWLSLSLARPPATSDFLPPLPSLPITRNPPASSPGRPPRLQCKRYPTSRAPPGTAGTR